MKLALLGYQGLAAAAMRAVAAAEASTAGGGALGGGSTGGARRGVTPTVPSERAVAGAVLALLAAVPALLVALLRRGPPASCVYREFSGATSPSGPPAGPPPPTGAPRGRSADRRGKAAASAASAAPRPDPPFAGRPAWQRRLVLPAGWWAASPDRLRFGALFGGLRGPASFWFAAVPLLRALALAAASEATRDCDVRVGVVVATLVLPLGAHALRRPLRTGLAHAAACAAAVLTLAAIGAGHAGAAAAAPLAALAAAVTIAGSVATFLMHRRKQKGWVTQEIAATGAAAGGPRGPPATAGRRAGPPPNANANAEGDHAAPLLVVPAAATAPGLGDGRGGNGGDDDGFRVQDRPGAGQWYGQATTRREAERAPPAGDGSHHGPGRPPRRSSSGGSSGSSTRNGGGGGAAPANPLGSRGGRPAPSKR